MESTLMIVITIVCATGLIIAGIVDIKNILKDILQEQQQEYTRLIEQEKFENRRIRIDKEGT